MTAIDDNNAVRYSSGEQKRTYTVAKSYCVQAQGCTVKYKSINYQIKFNELQF